MNLSIYTYKNILNIALSRVPNTVDKTEGSVIYDALAPACYVLAQYYMDLKNVLDVSFVETSYDEYLDLLVGQIGITRLKATYAIKKGEFKNSDGEYVDITIGDRFATNDGSDLIYKATKKIEVGIYEMTCETEGVIGNVYVGDITPITIVDDVETAILTDTLTLARDEEDDDSLKERYRQQVNEPSFGGNVSEYIELFREKSGIGDVQVYPVWNGGGTVKCSVIDTEMNPVTQSVIDTLKEEVDPYDYSGQGYGLAPIGHEVTITTPTELTLDISAELQLEDGYGIPDVKQEIIDGINEYIDSIRKTWGTMTNYSYVKTIYIARILSKILTVDGVINGLNVTINGEDDDVILVETGLTQQIPKVGEITFVQSGALNPIATTEEATDVNQIATITLTNATFSGGATDLSNWTIAGETGSGMVVDEIYLTGGNRTANISFKKVGTLSDSVITMLPNINIISSGLPLDDAQTVMNYTVPVVYANASCTTNIQIKELDTKQEVEDGSAIIELTDGSTFTSNALNISKWNVSKTGTSNISIKSIELINASTIKFNFTASSNYATVSTSGEIKVKPIDYREINDNKVFADYIKIADILIRQPIVVDNDDVIFENKANVTGTVQVSNDILKLTDDDVIEAGTLLSIKAVPDFNITRYLMTSDNYTITTDGTTNLKDAIQISYQANTKEFNIIIQQPITIQKNNSTYIKIQIPNNANLVERYRFDEPLKIVEFI